MILRLVDGAYIAKDPENRDYAKYLAWMDSGGTTLPELTEEELAQQKALLDASVESAWRTTELQVIARQMEALEEAAAGVPTPDLLPGTKQQWLKFRGQLSNWKDGNEHFPEQNQRPVRPA
ncbi:hypothetical protein [Pseudomonas sp. GW456-12-1-14-TSB6]|uniref:hypothetical protein n=1 Tax=Pseudomonas sp. GW456-12-1-14-TSB6 TaxID=2751350 RepID=UPI000CD30A6F|nr:hypothetical protein [Pseudomonas sp. GW456-12-1-14-TSB6]POA40737.1 hypothetical protein C1891_00235 [Pseudomonas sp. GW456-12-1-14-TSB6]